MLLDINERGKYKDHLPLDGLEVIVWVRTSGRTMGIFPRWKGIEYATDNEMDFISLADVGPYMRSRS